MTTPEKQLEKLNKKVKQLFDLYEIDFEDPTELNFEMKFALAKFYGDMGVRKALENMVKKAERDGRSCITVLDIVKIKERINTLMQLLTISKVLYNQSEKLSKVEIKEVVENEV